MPTVQFWGPRDNKEKGLNVSREGNVAGEGSAAPKAAEGTGRPQPEEKKTRELPILQNSLTGRCSQVEVRLHSQGTKDRIRGSGHKLSQGY